MQITPRFYRIAALSFALAACQTTSLQIDPARPDAAGFEQFDTYAWQHDTANLIGAVGVDEKRFHERVRGFVDQALADKGYRKSATGEADFLIEYYAILDYKTEVEKTYDGRTGDPFEASPGDLGRGDVFPRWDVSRQPRVREYEQGTLVIYALVPGTEKELWRGSATAVVDLSASEEKRRRKLEQAVNGILQNLPLQGRESLKRGMRY